MDKSKTVRMEKVSNRECRIPQITSHSSKQYFCTACNKVATIGVEYKNKIWHRQCFTCCNCTKTLAGKKFLSNKEEPYCFECYGDLFAFRCAKCKSPIHGIGDIFVVNFAKRHWHVGCFVCSICEQPLLGQLVVNKNSDVICTNCA